MALIGRLRRIVTTEPVLFICMFSHSCLSTIRVEYVKEAVGEMYNYTPGTSSSSCEVNKSDPNYILGEKVQGETSYWLLYYETTSAVLTLFSAMFLGSYSERGGGKKLVLLISCVGFTLYAFCVQLVFLLDLPLPYLFIAEIIRGITGNTFTVMAMSYALVADESPGKYRTIRMIVLESSMFIGGGVSQGVTGQWIESVGFIPPTWLIYGVLIFIIFYVVIWLEETVPEGKSSTWGLYQAYHDIVQLFAVASRETRIHQAVYNACLFVIFLVIGSYTSMVTLYILSYPFCFTPSYVGYYMAIFFSSNAIGMLIVGNILSLCVGDLVLAQAAFISFTANLLMIAFANNKWQILVGVLFAIQGCIQGVGNCISPIIFNSVYSATVDVIPGLVFILYASCLVIPMVLIGAVQVWEREKNPRRERQPPLIVQ